MGDKSPKSKKRGQSQKDASKKAGEAKAKDKQAKQGQSGGIGKK